MRESENDSKELVVSFQEALQPVGGFEEFFVQKLAFIALRLSRVYKVDVRIAPLLLDAIRKNLTEDQFQHWQLRELPGPAGQSTTSEASKGR